MPTLRHFVGRNRDLQRLHRHLDAVTTDGRGRLISIRGRRQAGKSRMVTEFTDRTRLPQLFFTASRLAIPAEELARFASEAAQSTLPDATAFGDARLSTWSDALRMTASALPDGPAIVVLDEFPWLCESNPSLEGTLQTAWDRLFEPKPVLFILIGSDIAMMEALSTYERPLFGRAKEMVVNPFKLGDTAAMIGVDDPAVAIDAQLITGGYPRLCIEWRDAPDARTFFGRQLADENSDLIDVGRNVLGAEFPPGLQARQVLTAIGAGERTNKLIGARSGLQAAPLARSLQTLKETKRVVAADLPLSTRPRNDPRYRVADTYLRFWLRFIEPSLPDIARGRPDLALARVNHAWMDYRGQAVEPLIRESVELLASDDPELPEVSIVGGYWTRTNDVEVDLVGVDRWPGASQVAMVGSIKWRERLAFDRHDLNALAAHRAEVPGAADARLIAVSRSGCGVTDVDRAYGPRDLIAAWR